MPQQAGTSCNDQPADPHSSILLHTCVLPGCLQHKHTRGALQRQAAQTASASGTTPEPLLASCRVKEHCIQRGFKWGEGLSSTSSGEHEYYEELLRFFRHSMRVSWLSCLHHTGQMQACCGGPVASCKLQVPALSAVQNPAPLTSAAEQAVS